MKFSTLIDRLHAQMHRSSFTKKDVRNFLRNLTQILKHLPPGEKTFIKDFGTFQRKMRKARNIVGFDGETTYIHPTQIILTFRETRKRKADGT